MEIDAGFAGAGSWGSENGILKQAGNRLSRELISLSEPFFPWFCAVGNFSYRVRS